MSDSLTMVVTDAGRAALVNAQNTGTAPVLVAAIGVTDQAFTPAPDLAAIPGELKQLATISGAVTAADTIHVIISDDGADTYSLRGFGLYLDDGTLLASYGQADAIMEKSAQATLLLTTDTIFADIDATALTFGDTNFVNPAATTDVQGVVELATAAEATAGTDAVRAMTPAAHKAATDSRFGAGAPSTFIKSLLTLASKAALWTALEIKTAANYDIGAGNGLDADQLDGQHGAYYLAWANLTGVPTAFPPAAHTHTWDQVTGKPATATRWPAWTEVTEKPTTFTPAPHSQDWSTILNPPAQATRWPAWTEVTGKPTLFPPASHTQDWSTILNPPAQATRWPTWAEVTEKPSNVKNLDALLAARALDSDVVHIANTETVVGQKTFAPGGGGFPSGLPDYHSLLVGARLQGDTIASLLLNPVDAQTGVSLEYVSPDGIFRIRNWYGGVSTLMEMDQYNITAHLPLTAPSFVSSASSRRVKHDIAACRYGLAEFVQIPWVEYRYNHAVTPDSRLRFGAIVEDVEPIAPELIIRRNGKVPTFDYQQFIPIIGRALQQYIDQTDARLRALEDRLLALEKSA